MWQLMMKNIRPYFGDRSEWQQEIFLIVKEEKTNG